MRHLQLECSRELFRALTQHPFYRWANSLIGAMNAPNPATWSALSFYEFTHRSFHVFFAGGLLFDGCHPTEPLVTRERGDIFPSCQCFWRSQEGSTQIGRHFMHGAIRNFCCHMPILHACPSLRLFMSENAVCNLLLMLL